MITQQRLETRHTPTGGPRERGQQGAASALCAAALLGCVLSATGCKTGTSFAKPSWWTFGGAPKVEGDTLASAPPYGGEIKKPSDTAKPYPTTSTPSGYALAGAASPADAAAQPFQAASPQSPVVYGTTPPPVATAVAAAPAAPAVPSQAAAIAPQVGPYAAIGGDPIPPPGQPLPPIAPSMPTAMPAIAAGSAMGAGSMAGMASAPATTPAETTLPNTAYSTFSSAAAGAGGMAGAGAGMPQPAPRLADARGSDPAAPIPAAALPVDAAAGGSRYSASNGSRFSGAAEAASFQPNVGAPPAAYGMPAETPYPHAPAAAPVVAPQPGVPATPGLLEPSTSPVRRPDPVYRPFGTSSYRPSRAILAEDSAPAAEVVRTAAYEEPVGGAIQQ